MKGVLFMNTKKLVTLSMLVAIQVVLSRFVSIQMWNFKVGFGFVPVIIAAIRMGPIEAGICGAMADFIGAMLFPTGAFFPGFTLTAALIGVVYGLFLHKEQGIVRVISSVVINRVLFTIFLNSLWISMLYGSPMKALMTTRLIQRAIIIPVQTVSIMLLAPLAVRLKKQMNFK